MPEKKQPKEKKPLDMTTDEAMEFLLGQEGAQKLKEAAQPIVAPPDKKELNAAVKSSRQHTSR